MLISEYSYIFSSVKTVKYLINNSVHINNKNYEEKIILMYVSKYIS